jgi:hypothetical protein
VVVEFGARRFCCWGWLRMVDENGGMRCSTTGTWTYHDGLSASVGRVASLLFREWRVRGGTSRGAAVVVFLEGCGNGKWHDDGAPCRLWLKKLSAKPSPAADCRGFLGQRLPPASRSPPGGKPAWHPEDSCQDFCWPCRELSFLALS